VVHLILGFNLIVQQYNTIFTIDVRHTIIHKRFSQREEKKILIFIKLLKIENHWFIITKCTSCILHTYYSIIENLENSI